MVEPNTDFFIFDVHFVCAVSVCDGARNAAENPRKCAFVGENWADCDGVVGCFAVFAN